MKFGEAFEEASVPEWSLNNINYDSLKRNIKVHTTKGQASAIAIPGHPDSALDRFENDLYGQLKAEHDRAGRFVALKAAELGWRLQKHTKEVEGFIVRCARKGLSQKRLLRFAKLERAIGECSDETRDLSRFVNAQKVAFHKILKKYKKWTGSGSLSSRFKEHVLSDPKSFTRRDFRPIQEECDDLLSTLRGAVPEGSSSITPSSTPATPARRRAGSVAARRGSLGPVQPYPVVHAPYWNEYENGSDAGDADGGYVIYVDPDESAFPALNFLSWLKVPLAKAKVLMVGDDGEDAPLLPAHATAGAQGESRLLGYGAVEGSYFGRPTGTSIAGGHTTDTDGDEDAFASDLEFPRGYQTYHAGLPSVESQRMAQNREKILFWSSIGSFAASIVLLGVAAVLIATGRHRLRVEVDAGATVGVVASLTSACAAVGLSLARKDPPSLANSLAVWVTFSVVCILNGMLLVLIVGNAS